jgi:sugar phosphate permease
MRIDAIAGIAVNQLLGRALRRLLVAALMVLFALVALYQFTSAGTLALAADHGPLSAHLIVGAIYSGAALVAFAAVWAMRPKPANAGMPALAEPRQMQLVMLIEAAMLGYALARKSDRAR